MSTKIPLKSFCVGQLLQGVGFVYLVRLHWPWVSITDSWLVSGWEAMFISCLPVAEIHLAYLCWTWAQALWFHMCTSPAVSRRHYFFGVIHPLWFLQSFHIFITEPWALTGGLWWNAPKSLTSCTLPCSDLCVSFHLPWGASLTISKQGSGPR